MKNEKKKSKSNEFYTPSIYEKRKNQIESGTQEIDTIKYTKEENVVDKISEGIVDQTAIADWNTGKEPYGTAKPWRKVFTAKIEK